jgi:predicted SAM-dependent methyltransferase
VRPYKYELPFTLIDTFAVGMDRTVPHWLPYLPGPILNLGAGKKHIEGTVAVDLPDWHAGEAIPYLDGEVSGVVAFHFFEHLDGAIAVAVLREIERILRPGGVLNTVIPFWDSEGAHQDIDHKSTWSESSWKNLLENPYYDTTVPRDWKLVENITMIMGLVQRNLVIVSQLVREA